MHERALVARVRDEFGVVLGRLVPVRGGADLAASLWRSADPDGREYAVKLTGGGSRAGLVVPAWLAGLGVPGVPEPIRARDGRPYAELDGRRLSLLPWLPGPGALDGGMTPARWRGFGRLLGAVHAAVPGAEVTRDLPVEEHRNDRFASVVRELDARLRRPGDDPGDDLVDALRVDWLASADRIAAVLDRADRLGARLRGRPAELVVCHADPHLGNVLLDGDHVWLIDWDDAVLAPRERDLMFVLGGVLPFQPVTEREWAEFRAGYGPVEPDADRLAYHRCVRALEDLGELAEQVRAAERWTRPEREEALGHARGVLSETGLIRQVLGR